MENEVQTKKEGWNWSRHKPNNVLNIDASSSMDFFKWWCTLIHPFVELTPREIDVIASFLKQRLELSQQVPPELVDRLLMSNETKSKVIEDCHITQSHFYVVMSTLKKKKVISDKGINPRLIPNVRKDDNGVFQLLILIKNNQKDDL